MESLARNFNTELNFWELNSVFKTIKEFNKLYQSDKSKDKKDSSKLMWAIALLVDPHPDNVWRNLKESDKRTLIAEDYLNTPKFDWDDPDVMELIKVYETRSISAAEREYLRLIRKMEERGDFIESTPYKLDSFDEETNRVVKGTADQLDKMVVNTIKIYEQMELIRKTIATEQNGGTVRGSGVESASEKGDL